MTNCADNSRRSGVALRLVAVVPPALLIVLTLFLFLPFAIYKGNIEEFVVPFPAILSNLFLPGLIVFIISVLIGTLLRGASHRLWVALVFAVGLLLWIQGSLIVWDYGDLNGVNIDWGEYASRAIIDTVIWVAVIALALIFSGRVCRRALFISSLLIALQFAYLGFQSVSAGEGKARQAVVAEEEGRPTEAIFDFSKKQNVIHVILDAFQSKIFSEIVAEDPDRYKAVFDGFTFFEENTGLFTSTYLSIPAILSGKVYENDRPMEDFFEEAMGGKTILSTAHKNGFEVDKVLMSGHFARGPHTNLFVIPRPYGMSKKEHARVNTAFIVDLALFRSLPQIFKKEIYNDQQWFFQSAFLKDREGEVFRHFTDKTFLYDMIDNARVTREAPVYKYLHLWVSHPPYVVNKDCGYTGRPLEHSKEVATDLQRCALGYFVDFIERLKEIDVYDSALIIVHADHGHFSTAVRMKGMTAETDRNLPIIAGSAVPLLAIKPPMSKGPLKVSGALTTLTDIPDTISSLLGFDEKFGSVSVFDIDESEVRERRYSHMNYWTEDLYEGGYVDNLMPFIIKGSAFDSASWHAVDPNFSGEASFSTAKVDFGTFESRKYKRFGWGANVTGSDGKSTYTVVMSSKVSLFLSLPKDKDVTFSVVIAPSPGSKPVLVSLLVDGARSPKRGIVNKPNTHNRLTFIVSPDRDRGSVSIVEFEFSEASGGAPIGAERLAFESLTIKED